MLGLSLIMRMQNLVKCTGTVQSGHKNEIFTFHCYALAVNKSSVIGVHQSGG